MTITEEITKIVTQEAFGIWFLIGAALVFLMQAGFAMVETGFTRAKNAGNIIMKNLMDFCIGTVVFVLLGFSLMMSENYLFGFIGVPNLQIFTDFGSFLSDGMAPSFVFNLVFCATAATIVSGSMAERTRFISYCVYSAVISLFVYPVEAGWVWNSQGWLVQLGFHDFAGSADINSVSANTTATRTVRLQRLTQFPVMQLRSALSDASSSGSAGTASTALPHGTAFLLQASSLRRPSLPRLQHAPRSCSPGSKTASPMFPCV